jgi:hypothetical protein
VRELPAALRQALAVRQMRVMSDVEFLDYIRTKLFSPLVLGGTHFLLADFVAPLDGVECLVCGHDFHWDFSCGTMLTDVNGEPWLCECPTKAALQAA